MLAHARPVQQVPTKALLARLPVPHVVVVRTAVLVPLAVLPGLPVLLAAMSAIHPVLRQIAPVPTARQASILIPPISHLAKPSPPVLLAPMSVHQVMLPLISNVRPVQLVSTHQVAMLAPVPPGVYVGLARLSRALVLLPLIVCA